MLLSATALLLVLGGCATPPPTALIVRVRTNLPVGSTLTAFELRAQRDGVAMPLTDQRVDLATGERTLPATVAIVPHDVADRRSVTVAVTGIVTGGHRVVQRARIPIAYAHVGLLDMFLADECVDFACPPGQTCTLDTSAGRPACTDEMRTVLPDVDAPCGEFHGECCATGAACAPGLRCVQNRCQVCPDADEACCDGQRVLADGTECAPASDPCKLSGQCTAGACGPLRNVPDGTSCGAAPDPCHAAPVCRNGSCQAPIAASDGTSCAPAPDACHTASTCRAGVCQPAPARPDGAVCADATDACHINGMCSAGRCTGLSNAPDGTSCAPRNKCQTGGTCRSGVCSNVTNVTNGTVCLPTTDPCKKPGVCTNGVCGSITNRTNGTVCAPSTNPCVEPGTCTSGVCGPQRRDRDGTVATTNPLIRCCGGVATRINTATDCNACGIRCASGRSCIQRGGSGPYYCSCDGTNSQCWSGCCSTFYGTPYVCASSDCRNPATCQGCPTYTTCHGMPGSSYPYYCGY